MADGTEWSLEYDAPQYFDFTKISAAADEFANDNDDYFNTDHELLRAIPPELLRAIPQSVGGNTAKDLLKQEHDLTDQVSDVQLGSNTTNVEVLSSAMNKLNVSDYKIKSKDSIRIEISDLLPDSKENISDPLKNSSELVPDILSQIYPGSKVEEHVENDDDISELKSDGDHTESSCCSDNQNPVKFPPRANEVIIPDPEDVQQIESSHYYDSMEMPNESASVTRKNDLPNKSPGHNRGRPLERGCRRVDEVSDAKKRLSMSVDRGHAKLRHLSPSPTRERESSVDRKGNHKERISKLHSADTKMFGSALLLHKLCPNANNQIIPEAQEELNSSGFVKAIIENSNALVEEEKREINGLVPHTGVPFQPQSNHCVTQPKPFSFEERTKNMLMKKQEKMKKLQDKEKKVYEFHARPFPEIIYSGARQRKVKPQAKPSAKQVPLNVHEPHPVLKAAAVGEPKSTFHAKPAKGLPREPFIPEKTAQHTKEFVQVGLSTKPRTEHRAEYERQKRERLARMEQERLDKERQLREQEEQEIRRLRASTVQKAHRIRHYRPIAVVPSDKPATVPRSPTFSRK